MIATDACGAARHSFPRLQNAGGVVGQILAMTDDADRGQPH